MFRIDQPTAAASLPTPAAPGTQGYFTNGNPGSGTPATVLDADWANRIQEELMAIILAGGLTPSKTTNNQVLTAIQSFAATQASAKAWVSFSCTGGAVTIKSSYNIASVTRVTTGVYTVAFTTAMHDANYAVVGTTSDDLTAGSGIQAVSLNTAFYGGTDPTTTSFKFGNAFSGSTPGAIDSDRTSLIIFGN